MRDCENEGACSMHGSDFNQKICQGQNFQETQAWVGHNIETVQGRTADSCEQDNEPSGSIKRGLLLCMWATVSFLCCAELAAERADTKRAAGGRKCVQWIPEPQMTCRLMPHCLTAFIRIYLAYRPLMTSGRWERFLQAFSQPRYLSVMITSPWQHSSSTVGRSRHA